MSQFYLGLQATARKLLQQYGGKVEFRRLSSSGYDPTTGPQTGSPIKFSGYGAVTHFDVSQVDGSNILATDIKLILESVKREPKKGDFVKLPDGTELMVVGVMPIRPASITVSYTCQLREGDASVR